MSAEMSRKPNRRDVLRAAGMGLAAASLPITLRQGRAAEPLKVAVFVPDSGPAALFGPACHAAAQIGADTVNAAGGILGRKAEITFADAGVPPAEAAKSAIRLLLSQKVDLIMGSHDSAVRQALEATIKGKVPYIYTPVYEGGDCAAHTFYLGETPEQQIAPSLPKLVDIAGGKTVYLIGNDYVWPRTTNARAKEMVAKLGGRIVGEEYYPLGAPNKFESSIQKIKSAGPAIVLQTLVGGDNVNFNRTFADFGLAKNMVRMSCLLEENTLAGIGKDASANLYSCLGYFSVIDTPENKAFLAAQKKKFGDKAPVQNAISKGLYDAFSMVNAVAGKAKSLDASHFTTAAEGVHFDTPSGQMTLHHRHATKTMYLARCDGAAFKIVDTFNEVPTQQTCS
jgi:urea transport system substrate-binding protein